MGCKITIITAQMTKKSSHPEAKCQRPRTSITAGLSPNLHSEIGLPPTSTLCATKSSLSALVSVKRIPCYLKN